MRTFITDKEIDLPSLGRRLAGGVELRAGVLDRLAALNPHIDVRRIEAGTVLFIPDDAGFADSESASVSGEAFGRLREELLESIDAASARALTAHEALLGEGKEVAGLLKSAVLNRAAEADPELKAQVDEAVATFKSDQQQAKEAARTLSTLQEQAVAELGLLARLLG